MNPVNQPDFEILITQYKGIIYKVANSYCKDADDRKDLVQEIILQLWRSFPSFNNSVKVSTWMYRVALNVAITLYRRDSRRKNVTDELSDDLIEIIPDEEPSETEGQLSKLQQFISELKELDRALMILYLEEKGQKEIADILGLTESNVSTKVDRIKQKLRERFSLTN
jgi:RNA polymerase sigma factor (sigma-70 family)